MLDNYKDPAVNKLRHACYNSVKRSNWQTMLLLMTHPPVLKKCKEVRKAIGIPLKGSWGLSKEAQEDWVNLAKKNEDKFTKILKEGIEWIWSHAKGLHYDTRFKDNIKLCIQAGIINAPDFSFVIFNDQKTINGEMVFYPEIKFYKAPTMDEMKYLKKAMDVFFERQNVPGQCQSFKNNKLLNEYVTFDHLCREKVGSEYLVSNVAGMPEDEKIYSIENALWETMEFHKHDIGLDSFIDINKEKETYRKRREQLQKEFQKRTGWQA